MWMDVAYIRRSAQQLFCATKPSADHDRMQSRTPPMAGDGPIILVVCLRI